MKALGALPGRHPTQPMTWLHHRPLLLPATPHTHTHTLQVRSARCADVPATPQRATPVAEAATRHRGASLPPKY